VTTAERRTRTLKRRRLLAALVGLLAVATTIALASGGGGGATHPPRTARSHARTATRPAAAAPIRQPRPTPVELRQNRAVDAVLRYTPFATRGGGHRREVALTFDDGPGPLTGAVLNVLRRRRAPATFFIVGQQLNDFASGLRAELRGGFAVGDHTENHAWLRRLKPTAQFGQIRDEAQRAGAFGAHYPRLFRPPYGAFNKATIAITRRLRMLIVLWSVDPDDWRRPGAGAIVHRVLGQATPGAIVLLHDAGGPRAQTVAALPAIIDGLRRRHLTLVTVPQLLLDDPPPRHQKLPRFTGA
jgi:peptidoglycan/xylan/chitin deacetylase (PgdA/CDA1 family)